MLVKALSRQNISPDVVEASRLAAQGGLDTLWKEPWITDSVTHRDEKLLAELKGWADDIRSRAGLVVVVAGEESAAIRGAIDAVPGRTGSPEVIVWDGSLAPGDFAALIRKIDGVSTAMIAVSSGKETLRQRAAYAIVKQAIFAAHHDEEGEKVYAVCPRGLGEIAMDAEENVYPTAEWTPGTEKMPANTAAVLLPLMIKGADAAEYLRGFYDTVCSPKWDTDAAVPAYVMARELKKAKAEGCFAGCPEILSWQTETRGLALRMAEKLGGRALSMPMDAGNAGKAGSESAPCLRMLIASDSGHQDIMTPPFEGCDPDGSLELLLKSEADSEFFGSADEDGIQGFKFCTEELDARSAGALTARLEMTAWLTDYFVR